MLVGPGLRVWAARALGRYYTRTLRATADQPVVRAAPYRLVWHPGYAANLLLWVGFGLATGNVVVLGVIGGHGGSRMPAGSPPRRPCSSRSWASLIGRISARRRGSRWACSNDTRGLRTFDVDCADCAYCAILGAVVHRTRNPNWPCRGHPRDDASMAQARSSCCTASGMLCAASSAHSSENRGASCLSLRISSLSSGRSRCSRSA